MQLKRGAWSWYRQGTAIRGRRSPARELIVRHGRPPDGRARTLYDLIGASPDDNTEGLKEAFYKAVKANHPDLHPDDPDAAVRFSNIVRAYAILRDAHERASYDRGLELERQSLRRFGTMRRILAEARAVAALAVVFSGGYLVIAHVLSQFPDNSKVVEVRAPATITVDELGGQRGAARATTTEREEPPERPVDVAVTNMTMADRAVTAAAKSSDALEVVDAQPVEDAKVKSTKAGNAKLDPSPPEPVAEGEIKDFGPASHQAEGTTAGDQSIGNHQIGPPDQIQEAKPTPVETAPVPVRLSSLGSDNTIARSSSPDLSASERKHRAETLDVKSQNAKLTKLTTRERSRTAEARPPSFDRAPTKQVSLENKDTSRCSENQSCSGEPAPLLGLGF